MCGIAGLIDLTGRCPLPPGVLQRMADALIHRGPDDQGFLEQPGFGLAVRRLSILDLQGGHQPITNENRTVWAAFNGELFDYREVRQDLETRGHRFTTHCDTELIPHLWEEYGEAMFEHLHGQFAFALWDERRQRLILARDRFGICPLFWTKVRTPTATWLLFASEIKALLASGLVEARADPRGINQLFSFLAVPGPVTCFLGIETFQPGHFRSIQLGPNGDEARIEDHTFWQIDFPDEGLEGPENDLGRLTDQFEEVLYRAVERRLRADVPVVSYLSGGVDSSLIVAMASKILGRPIPTFTVSVADPALDETPYAQQVARHVGAESVMVTYDARQMLGKYAELIWSAESPVIDTSAAANLLLAESVHARCFKVVLTGEGADEWLGGYPWFHALRLLRWLTYFPRLGLTDLAVRAHLWWMRAPEGTYEQIKSAETAVGGHNIWLTFTTTMGMSRLRFFSQEMKARLAGHEPHADLQLDIERVRRWHPLHRGLCVGARTLLAGMLLTAKGDRVALHSSVETRYPFLDEQVVAFLANVHPRWKLRGFTEKYLLRCVAERWLPRPIAWRRKAMFRAPLDPFHAPDAPAFFDQLLSPPSLRRSGYFDVEAVSAWRKQYQALRAGSLARVAVELGLVGVVATQLWHHLFIDPNLCYLPAGFALCANRYRS